MVVFGSKSSASRTKLFEQPLEKLFNPKAIKQFNETIAASNLRSPPALCQSLSAPLTSSTLTWAKLSKENSASKRKRAAARLRRFTIDANNNTPAASLITTITSAPLASAVLSPHLTGSSHNLATTGCQPLATADATRATSGHDSAFSGHSIISQGPHERLIGADPSADDHEQSCRLLLLNVLPEPIRCLLQEIYLRGPATVGIFRKSPNAKHCKELKQKLETVSLSSSSSSNPLNLTSSSSNPTSSSGGKALLPSQPLLAAAAAAQTSECQLLMEQYQVNVIASVFKVSVMVVFFAFGCNGRVVVVVSVYFHP